MFFFFKQKTAYEILRSDWSSDVCSSDLSGYGAYYYVELTEKQKDLVAFLRQRMWTETLIPWMLGLAGIGDDENVINCLRDDLMQDADLKAALASLARRIKVEEDAIEADPKGGL